jgi:hypothetical protein
MSLYGGTEPTIGSPTANGFWYGSYPREAPDGDQIELMEVMGIEHGLIQRHRIYWGWFGVNQLTQNAVRKATLTA